MVRLRSAFVWFVVVLLSSFAFYAGAQTEACGRSSRYRSCAGSQ